MIMVHSSEGTEVMCIRDRTLYVPILTGHAVDAIAGENLVDFQTLFTLITGISVSISITAIAQWTMNHVNNLITYRIVRSLRTQAFEHLQELPLSYVDQMCIRDRKIFSQNRPSFSGFSVL